MKWSRKNGALVNRAMQRKSEEGVNYFKEFWKVVKHFFPKMLQWLNDVKDPRNPSYVDYDACLILLMRIFGAAMSIKSMREITKRFNASVCIENFNLLLNDYSIEELPHYDTINDYLVVVDAAELESLRHKLIERLIQMKCLAAYKFKKRWLVSIDGTGLYVFKERHCEHCLTKTYNKGKPDEYTLYFHYVLEAKLTVGDMVFSLCHEFIENPENLQDKIFNENFCEKTKQDCETNAFYRLEKKLKKAYPRLPICLLLDSLYASKQVFEICQANDWEYLIRFKEGSIPTVAKEFEALSKYDGTTTNVISENVTSTYRYVNNIDYEGYKINVVECRESVENSDATRDEKTFTFIASPGIPIKDKDQIDIVMNGRKRWKIENQGFNEQKNHGYELEHVFSYDYNAMKNHYILIQIAHIIRQLFETGIKILKEFKKTLADISHCLLEAFRTKILLQSDLDDICIKCQIRIDRSCD